MSALQKIDILNITDVIAFIAMVIGLNPKASVIGAKKLKTIIEN